MKTNTPSDIKLSHLFDDSSIKKQLQYSFLFSFLFLFIAHSARFFNLAYTNDSLQIYQATDAYWQIHLGRWGQVLYCKLRGTIVVPYVIGLLCGLYISCAAFLITRMFNIQKKIYIAILCMFMTCNEALNSLNATFINSSDIIMFSMLLSVISVFFWNRWRFGFLLSAPLLTLSLSLYQADLQTAILLILLILFVNLLSTRDVNKTFVFKGLKGASYILAGILLYMVSLPIVYKHTQVTPSTHFNNVFSGNFLRTLFPRIIKTWAQPFEFILNPHALHPRLTSILFIVLISWTVILAFMYIFRVHKSHISKVILLLILLLLPFATNFSFFLSEITRERMTYAYSIIAVLPIVLTSKIIDSHSFRYSLIIHSIFLALSGLLFFNNLVYGNEYYIRRELEFDSTLSLMTRVVDRIEQTPGYTRDTNVVFIGTLYDSPLAMTRSGFEHIGERDDSNTTNVYAPSAPEKYYWYFWQILGYPLNLADEFTHQRLSAKKEVRTMPVFPEEGCIQFVDDILVVKLGYVYIPPEFL